MTRDPYKAEAAIAAGAPDPYAAPRRPPRGAAGNPAPKPWTLERALAFRAPFGKRRGETVAEIAARDPGYLEWLAETPIACRNLRVAARIVRAAVADGGEVAR